MIAPPAAAGDALAIVSAVADDADVDADADDADVDVDQLTLSYHGDVYVFGAVSPLMVQAVLMLLGGRVATSDRFDELLNFDNQVKFTGRREFPTRMPRDEAHFTSSKLEQNATFGVTSCDRSQHLDHMDARPSEPECDHCGINAQSTLNMRHVPKGPRNLCNACGLTWSEKIPAEYTYLPQNGQSFSQQSQRNREALEKDASWGKDTRINPITGFAQSVDQRVTDSEENGAAPSTQKATHRDASFIPAIAAVPLTIYTPTECATPDLEASGGETPPSKFVIAQRARRQREAAEKEARMIELSQKRQRKVDEHGGSAPSNYVVAQRARRQREEQEKAQRIEAIEKQQREVEEHGGASLSKHTIAQRARRLREAEEKKARRMQFSKNLQRQEAEYGGSAPSKLVFAQHAPGQREEEENEAQRMEFSQRQQRQEAEFGGSAPSELVISQRTPFQNRAEEEEACGIEVTPKQQREAEEHGRAGLSNQAIAQRARRQREAEEKARRLAAIFGRSERS